MSDFKHYHKENGEKVANPIDNTNGIVDHMKEYLTDRNAILFIASSPDDKEKMELYSSLLFEGLKLSGISFDEYLLLDNSTANKAEEYIKKANIIFLSGGDTFVQNEFFNKINLKEKLANYNGLLIGLSAGAINMAEDAFNSPEEMKESEPIFFKGLGLTDINIEPHFVLDSSDFDESEKYQRDFILNESNNRKIYGQCNGSHILIDNEGQVLICGETYLISNAEIVSICGNGEKVILNNNKTFNYIRKEID